MKENTRKENNMFLTPETNSIPTKILKDYKPEFNIINPNLLVT